MPVRAEAFAERLKVQEEFVRIERELGQLPIAARDALLWQATEDKTGTMIAEHQATCIFTFSPMTH